MAKSADHRRHLNHPVISSFLALKWSRISFLYNINIVFVFLMVAILTSYIFANYAGPSLDVTSPLCFADLNATERLSEGVSRSAHGNDLTLRILLIVLLAVLSGRELIQFMVAPIKHLKSFENILEILLIILLSVVLFHGDPGCYLVEKRELSAAVLLISWMELLSMLGRHPTWHWCNIYSTMFFSVLTTFLTFLLWYSLFIIAFGLGFFILLHSDVEMNKKEEEKPKFFDHIGLSLVKTFSMFVGELEFSEVPFQVSPRFSYIFFLIFVFLMVVVLMNLLNGLAVTDTGRIQEEAELYTAEGRVEVIHQLETTLACLHRGSWGWLSRITNSFSCHLFFEVLPEPWLRVEPNKRSAASCRCLVLLPCSCPREPETVIAGSPGLLRAARDKLVARERGKGEVEVQALLRELKDVLGEMKRGKTSNMQRSQML